MNSQRPFIPGHPVYDVIFGILQGENTSPEIKAIFDVLKVAVEEDLNSTAEKGVAPTESKIPLRLVVPGGIEDFATEWVDADADEVGYVHVIPVGCGMDNPNPDPMDAPLVWIEASKRLEE